MKSSQELFERALKLIPGGVNSPVRAFRSVSGTPFFTKSANGCRLETVDGKELIDFVCTWGPAIHGHNHPAIQEAVIDAARRGVSFGTPSPMEVDMAEMIIDMVPGAEMVRMVNSGTEATMSCIRLARGYTGRPKIIKFSGCYHGHVDSLLIKAGSGALTLGNPDSAGIPESFAQETIVLPFNDIAALESAFAEWSDSIAAVILEPYPANVGLILPGSGYLQRLKSICESNGSVLIFDEVMTGFRLALGGVHEIENIKPDLVALGKIIGGGLPVGALAGRAEIMRYLAPEGPVYQAGTLSGNPLAMAAGLASLRLLESERPYGRLNRLGERVASGIKDAATAVGLPVQVPQRGSMFSIFFSDSPVRNYESAIQSNTALFKKLFHYALENGVYLPPSPFETCFISTAHDDESIERAISVLQDGIRRLAEEQN